MNSAGYKLQVEKDHVRKLSSGRPIAALAELIWNSLDAESTEVTVEVHQSELIGSTEIRVRDNGHGIPFEENKERFGQLGGSWKVGRYRSESGKRFLHGKEGKGRFKALALGRVARWVVRYAKNQEIQQYTIEILEDDPTNIRVTNPVSVDINLGTGVDVIISEPPRYFRSLSDDRAITELSETFALYLTDYPEVEIKFNGTLLDPQSAIKQREEVSLPDIVVDEETYHVRLEIIEWKSASERWFFFCGDAGMPFQRIKPRIKAPGHQFSAYLKSSYIDLLQENGTLGLAELDSKLEKAWDSAVEKIRAHFSNLDAEAARSTIEEWKSQKIYPYKEDPKTNIEEAERKIFDIVALNVREQIPDFEDTDRKTKAYQLHMLRHALERGSDELQLILNEVLELPRKKQKELAKLLEEADLANVISSSRLVSDRQKFLIGLEKLLFETDYKKNLKERSQLHRLLADNTWVFGEEFTLSVDDRSLTEVLKKHKDLLGNNNTAIDKPVKLVSGKTGIVDLMLSRIIPRNHHEEREHLVVELKRPSVKVGSSEIQQIENYAFAVEADERFRGIDCRWNFIVVSTDMDDYATRKARQSHLPAGQIYESENKRLKVWVKTWSEVLAEANARYKFVQDALQASFTDEQVLTYLNSRYEKHLKGVIEIEEGDDASAGSSSAA